MDQVHDIFLEFCYWQQKGACLWAWHQKHFLWFNQNEHLIFNRKGLILLSFSVKKRMNNFPFFRASKCHSLKSELGPGLLICLVAPIVWYHLRSNWNFGNWFPFDIWRKFFHHIRLLQILVPKTSLKIDLTQLALQNSVTCRWFFIITAVPECSRRAGSVNNHNLWFARVANSLDNLLISTCYDLSKNRYTWSWKQKIKNPRT